MKRFFLTLASLLLIVEILLFPKEACSYAATGLSLWFDRMVPALFPFMVISSLIVRLDLAPGIVSLLHPVFKKMFRTNSYCEYVILMGFLCGYPMGAIIIKDLLSQKKITVEQADYLLSFCNNIGPVFFASLVLPIFEGRHTFLLLFGMYGIPFVYGILMRNTFYKKISDASPCKDFLYSAINPTGSEESFVQAFTSALNQAVSSILYLGACMIFFNMLRFLPSLVFDSNSYAGIIIAWLLEVNAALPLTANLVSDGKETLALLFLPFLSIGGLSCLCQSAGILHTTPCKLSIHFIHKIIQGILWFVFLLIFL